MYSSHRMTGRCASLGVLIAVVIAACGGATPRAREPILEPERDTRPLPTTPSVEATGDGVAVVDAATVATTEDRSVDDDAAIANGGLQVRGSLSKEVIRRIAFRHREELRHCYAVALADSPALSGTVVVAYAIEPNGSVGEASLDAASTMSNEEVAVCILSHVRQWTFPPPEGGGQVTVLQTFLFHPAMVIALRSPIVTGTRTAPQLLTELDGQLSHVRHCYDNGAHQPMTFTGTLSLRYVIAPDGSVREPSVIALDLVAPHNLAPCVTAAIGTWRFPPTTDGTAVTVMQELHAQSAASPHVE